MTILKTYGGYTNALIREKWSEHPELPQRIEPETLEHKAVMLASSPQGIPKIDV